jgi:PAS domain S-box-containing protein
MSLRALGLGRFGPWRHLLAFAAGTLLIGATTAVLVHHDHQLAESYWQGRLQTVAEDRAWVASEYLESRLRDAQGWAALPTFRAWLTDRAGNSHGIPLKPTHHTLDDFLSALNSIYAYPGVLLVDSQGEQLASAGDVRQPGSEALAICLDVVRNGTPQIAPLDVDLGKPLLVFVAPVRSDATEAPVRLLPVIGAIAIFARPASDLFPALKAEPVATRTEETLLIRREANQAVFLSPSRNPSSSAAVSILPLASVNPLIQAAFEGRESVGRVIDHRGVPGIAAVRRLPEAGWVIEEKIDSHEAYESFRRGAALESLCAGLLAVVLAAALVAHRHRQRVLKLLKEAERHQDLLRAEKYAADIADTVPAWMLVLTPDLRIESANQAFLKYFNIREDEIRGLSLGEVIRTEGLLRQVDQAVQGQATVEEVMLDVSVRGKEIKLPARITLADLVQGMLDRPQVLVIVEDLTESERLRLASEAKERELRETEARYRVLAESSADFIGTHDLKGTILSVTPGVALRVGFKDPQQMVGLKVTDFLPRDRWPEFDAYLGSLRREGRAQGIMKAISLGGEEIMVEFKNSVLQDDPEAKVVLCVGRDVTEIVRLRKALKKTVLVRQNLTKAGASGIARLDPEGRFAFINDRAAEICGYAANELKEKPFSVLLPPEEVEPFNRLTHPRVIDGVQMSTRDVTIVRKDGSRRSVRAHFTCIVRDGASRGALMAWKDLTGFR